MNPAVDTRLCRGCATRKSIRGVWYLIPQLGGEEGPFVCEACFNTTHDVPTGLSAPTVDDVGHPTGP